ncbi:MAG: M23 family metallopeptidase [Acidobacteriota bacterium]
MSGTARCGQQQPAPGPVSDVARPGGPMAGMLLLAAALTATGGVDSSAARAAAAVVTIEPARLVPGSPVRITVETSASTALTGRFADRDLTFLDRPGGGFVAFVGIDLDTAPGSYPLTVSIREPGRPPATQSFDLTVLPTSYPTEELTVAPRFVEPPATLTKRIEQEAALLASLWQRASPRRRFDGHVVRPLPGVPGRNFGRRRVFNGQPRSPHSGTDLSAPSGTPVPASAAGVVVVARNLYFSGNLVVLDHGGGVYTLYAHLSSIDVVEGETLPAGRILGTVGATGRVTGPHLHWGAHIGPARVDPIELLELLEGRAAGQTVSAAD